MTTEALGHHDEDTPTERDLVKEGARVLRALGDLGWSVAVAESLTGGQISSTLIGSPGSSSCVRGGVVAYATDTKETVLGVDGELLKEGGPVQAEVARQMARNVARLMGADVGIGTTGVAGPEPTPDGPPGLVYIGISAPGVNGESEGRVWAEKFLFDGERNEVRNHVVEAALDMVLACIGEEQ